MLKRLYIVIGVLFLYLTTSLMVLLVPRAVNPLKDLEYSQEQKVELSQMSQQKLNCYYNGSKLTDQEWKNKIYKEFGYVKVMEVRWLPFFTPEHSGAVPYFGLVLVGSEYTDIQYATTLAHELTHATTWIGDERKAQFETFKRMYESEDEYLHLVAWKIVQRSVQVNDNYTCTGLIIDYLKQKENLWI